MIRFAMGSKTLVLLGDSSAEKPEVELTNVVWIRRRDILVGTKRLRASGAKESPRVQRRRSKREYLSLKQLRRCSITHDDYSKLLILLM